MLESVSLIECLSFCKLIIDLFKWGRLKLSLVFSPELSILLSLGDFSSIEISLGLVMNGN